MSIAELRKLEKLCTKIRKAELDLQFLKNCQSFNVTPKFLSFRLPHASSHDTKSIRKRLLRGAIRKRNREIHALHANLEKLSATLRNHLSSLEWYILKSSVNRNVERAASSVVETHRKKMCQLTKNTILPFVADDVVKNLSSTKLTDDERNLLKYGLNFAIQPRKLSKTDICVSFEMIYRFFEKDLKSEGTKDQLKSQLSHLANNYYHSYKPSSSQQRKHRILSSLRKNKNIVILKPDKGNAVVILDREIYKRNIYDILSDQSKFKQLSSDPTVTRQTKLCTFLLGLKKQGLFADPALYQKLYPVGSRLARIYGLPKIHKIEKEGQIPPFRPIISSLGTFNYQLAKWLSDLLVPHLPTDYTASDTFSFVEDLSKQNLRGKTMVSFDVVSLFTNIPLHETIDIAVNLLLEKEPKLKKISASDLKRLFIFATAETNFLFDGKVYDQIDGVAMGSPLGPVLANLFMGHHESDWIHEYGATKVLYYRRYVDDIFAVFDTHDEAIKFFNFLNTRHDSIKFTMESENENCLSFLDIFVKNDQVMTTSVYRKSTFTGLLTNYESFTADSYKIGLVKNLLLRAFHISISWSTFHKELERIYKILQQNSFPKFLIDQITSSFMTKQVKEAKNSPVSSSEANEEIRYFKLPYIGKISELL